MSHYSGQDLARSFRIVRNNTIQIANDIPEAQYGFRATEDTRTIHEMLAHVASSTRWPYQLHGVDRKTFVSLEDFGAYIGAANNFAAELNNKADIIRALETDGDHFAAFLASMTEAALTELISFPAPVDPPTKTRFEMLLGVKEHEMHHRAQLMLIERLLGIVPHLTARRQQRQAR